MAIISIATTSRWPRLPVWVVVVVLSWLALVGVSALLSRLADEPAVTCNFRRLTGVPCPTCGTTRAVLATVDGRFVDAIALNPLMYAVGVVALGLLVLRVGFRRRAVITLSRMQRRAAWIAAIALVAANWAYVIWSHA